MCTRPWCALAGPAAKRALAAVQLKVHITYIALHLASLQLGFCAAKADIRRVLHHRQGSSHRCNGSTCAVHHPPPVRLSDCLKDSLSDKICTCTYTPLPGLTVSRTQALSHSQKSCKAQTRKRKENAIFFCNLMKKIVENVCVQ